MPSNLKPQDVMLALKLVAVGAEPWTQPGLAKALHMSAAEVNHGLKRLAACQLYLPSERRVMRANLRELLTFGLRYVFPAQLGGEASGMPTAHSAAPLASKLHVDARDAFVWATPTKKRAVRGRSVEPLYRSAPLAAAEDPRLHELLALTDALRVGRARERNLAREELDRRLAS
jgi:hypothetical protein